MYLETSNQDILEMGFGGYTCNWGTHICGLYGSEKERDDIIFGYLSKGVEKGDLQLYCPSERTPENFFEGMEHYCPLCKNHLNNPDIFQVLPPEQIYYPKGYFSPLDMDENLSEFYITSQKNGRRNIRATAEMSWAINTIPGVEDLMAYEARLNFFIPGKPWISICMYNLKKFSGAQIMNVLETHPYTISNGVITENPYYKSPELWLKQNAPQFLP